MAACPRARKSYLRVPHESRQFKQLRVEAGQGENSTPRSGVKVVSIDVRSDRMALGDTHLLSRPVDVSVLAHPIFSRYRLPPLPLPPTLRGFPSVSSGRDQFYKREKGTVGRARRGGVATKRKKRKRGRRARARARKPRPRKRDGRYENKEASTGGGQIDR